MTNNQKVFPDRSYFEVDNGVQQKEEKGEKKGNYTTLYLSKSARLVLQLDWQCQDEISKTAK